jgi:hypothetical protein
MRRGLLPQNADPGSVGGDADDVAWRQVGQVGRQPERGSRNIDVRSRGQEQPVAGGCLLAFGQEAGDRQLTWIVVWAAHTPYTWMYESGGAYRR